MGLTLTPNSVMMELLRTSVSWRTENKHVFLKTNERKDTPTAPAASAKGVELADLPFSCF